MRRAIFTVTLGLVWTLGAGGAAAQDGAALVLETSGAAVPAVKPYAEIRAGTAVTLAGDARLVLLHYRTCRTVTLVGGRISVGADTYAVVGGATVRETQGRCPRPVTLKADGEVVVGGVVTRSIGPAATRRSSSARSSAAIGRPQVRTG